MFFFSRKKKVYPLADIPIWIAPLHVKGGIEPLPTPLIGAYVQVFCRGDDPASATWAAIQAVEAMGYSVPDSPLKVDRMPASEFSAFVSAAWPELQADMPSQDEFYERMTERRAVIGPFAGYDTAV